MDQHDNIYRAIVPPGGHLASARSSVPGVSEEFLGAVLDSSNQLMGQARLVKVDIPDASPPTPPDVPSPVRNLAIGLAVGVVATVVVVKFSPRVKKWWLDQALPKSKATLRKVTRSVNVDDEDASEGADVSVVEPVDFAAEVEVALDGARVSMSSAEAQRHLLGVLMAAAFIADKVRLLSNARIEDGVDFPELHAAMNKLTTQRVADSINLLLEGNDSLLDENELVDFARLFGAQSDGEDRIVVHVEMIREALRLTGDDEPAAGPG